MLSPSLYHSTSRLLVFQAQIKAKRHIDARKRNKPEKLMLIKKRITFAMPKKALKDYPGKNPSVNLELPGMRFTPSLLAQRMNTYNNWCTKMAQAKAAAEPTELKTEEPERGLVAPELHAEPVDVQAENPEVDADGELKLELEAAGFRRVPPNPQEQPPKNRVQPPRHEPQAQEYVGPWRRAEDTEDDVPNEDERFIEESDPETDDGEINGLDLGAEEHQIEVIRLRRKAWKPKRKVGNSDSESEVSL